MRLFVLLLAASCLSGCAARTPSPDDGPPYEPEDALRTLVVPEGFHVELVAAEPLIADPVAIEIDEAGRLFVVEMPGYPMDVGGSGRVRLLTDTDGDGRPDHSTVFADGLTLPTGVMRWKEGILVTDPPHVLYLEDVDGDGRADVRRPLLTGLALSNPQHNANELLYGLDNWIYLAKSGTISWTDYEQFQDKGSELHFPDRPDADRLGRNGEDRNVRFRPDTYRLEMLSGETQFGQAFDAWGHHFGVSNANHHFHEVIAARYFHRAPDLPIRQVLHDTPDHGAAAEVYPITRNPEHQLLTDRGVFTSAAGITSYLADLFPDAYRNVTFVAEPVHNLVHADVVEDDGATFVARRLFEGREFLASTDGWFRPVNGYVGPDGAFYVVDYYRQIVEHPEWMDEATIASGQLQNGTERGRLYRVVPDGTPPLAWSGMTGLAGAPTEALVAALAKDNIWWRRHAQRLLMDRREEAAVVLLETMVRERPSPTARLHALWTLDGLGRLDPALIRLALTDPEAGVRENAVVLAERHREQTPGLMTDILTLTDDPHPKVRFQLLNTLGFVDTDAAAEARRRLLERDMEDPWVQTAALLASPTGRPGFFDDAVAAFGDRESPGRAAFVRRVAAVVGTRQPGDEVRSLLRRIAAPDAPWWRTAALDGLAEGLRRSGTLPPPLDDEQQRLLDAFFTGDAAFRSAVLAFFRAMGLPPTPSGHEARTRAAGLFADADADPRHRADALHLISLGDPSPYEDAIKAAITPSEHVVVQQAAVHALGRIDGPAPGAYLLDRWPTLTPAVRDAALDELMRSDDRVRLLLDAVEDRTVQPGALGWDRTVRLMRDTEGAILEKARALLSEQANVRADVLARYQAALAGGDPQQGRAVFTRVCSACHQVGGTGGTAFGPDLGTVRHWSGGALVTEILDPGRTLADGYELWTATLRTGDTATGVVAAETPTSITFRRAGGAETTVARADITGMTTANVSPMPTGLETQISESEMADLVAFLTNGALEGR